MIGIISGLWHDISSSFIAGICLFGPVSFIIAFLAAKGCFDPKQPTAIIIFIGFGFVVGFFFYLLFPAGSEWKFIFKPDIDTRFAPGYSEEAFESIKKGMSEREVVTILQEPLYKYEYGSNYSFPGQPEIVWWYTADGACSWWDFAWRTRGVGLRDGIVVGKVAYWSYD